MVYDQTHHDPPMASCKFLFAVVIFFATFTFEQCGKVERSDQREDCLLTG
jgi:hypothetical protein